MAKLTNLIAANWQSGVTVALLSLPFSVSLAVASQTTPTAGILTTIWAGLFGSLLGGSHFNIIGVTGALSGLLATYALCHGAQSLASLALVTGIFILIGYALRLERYLIFVPSAAIHGFTLGIAAMIALGQIGNAFGLTGLTPHHHFIDNVCEAVCHIQNYSGPATLVFALFFGALLLLTSIQPSIPWVILLTPAGILVGYLSSIGSLPSLPTLGSKFGTISAKLFSFTPLFFDSSLVKTGMVIALVAIIETMIAARIGDGLTKTKHNKRKEMFGLGIANIMSGIMGGIPATAAIGRTIFNIKTGATNRMSGIIYSITIAVISLLLLPYFTYAPMGLIAAILVHTAMRLVEMNHFVHMFNYDKTSFVVSLIVAGITVYVDPIIGILLGSALMLIIFMETLSQGSYATLVHGHPAKTKSAEQRVDSTLVYSIKGQLAYINAQSHTARLEQVMPNYETIILDLRELYFIDLDGVDALSEIIESLSNQHKQVLLVGISADIMNQLIRDPIIQKMQKNHHIFASTQEALAAISH